MNGEHLPPEGRRPRPEENSNLSAEGIGQQTGSGILLAVGVHRDGCDDLRILGHITHIGLDGGDGIHRFHTLHHAAEGGILTVQKETVLMHNEELAAGTVGCLCASHTQHAAAMLQIVHHTVGGELALDAVAGTAHTVAVGAAALEHKAGDHAGEDETVIDAAIGQRDEVAHALRCDVGIQLADDLAAVFHSNSCDRIHMLSPFVI